MAPAVFYNCVFNGCWIVGWVTQPWCDPRERGEGLKAGEWDESERGEEALGAFVPSDGTPSQAQLDRLDPDTRSQLLDVADIMNRNRPLEMDMEEDDMVQYPSALQVIAHPRGDIGLFPQADVGPRNTLGWYLMDGGSLLPVLSLDLQLGDHVLDVCAAPGGKSILMLQTMLPGRLVCNDNQVGRLNRLRNSLMAYIPETGTVAEGSGLPELRERITLCRSDASGPHWASENNHTEAYDKVLVDVPCTTDRHSLHISERGDTGSIFRRSRSGERMGLPQTQTRILFNALQSTKPGGTAVYSTCTLSPLQNEAVVEGAVELARKRLRQEWAVVNQGKLREDLSRAGVFRFYPHSRLGTLVLPFLPSNYGPMYICKLRRLK